MLQAFRRRGDASGGSDVAWDLAALYPPGALLEDAIPDPEFAGGIVVDVIDPLRERLTGAHSP